MSLISFGIFLHDSTKHFRYDSFSGLPNAVYVASTITHDGKDRNLPGFGGFGTSAATISNTLLADYFSHETRNTDPAFILNGFVTDFPSGVVIVVYG